MNARTFGKKGTASGESAAASRRAAFLAQERARADGESRVAETDVFPAAGPVRTIADRIEFVEKPKKVRAPVGPRSLTLAWALWFPWGLAGAHRLYLGRYASGAIQAAIFLACVTAVFGFQIYPAFAGLVLSWLWMLVDGMRLKQMHAEAVGTPRGAELVEV
ncbi:MAG TPA: TM2 domain-containing protein [Allosphingosinicella sp.]|nr:TM2 domain-containing protein [Allosphingosinicella sp.]